MAITKGSPKQIDWANQIVAAITPTFDTIRAAADKSPKMRDALIDAVGRVESNHNASYWIDMTLGCGVSGSVNKYAPAVNAVAAELVAIMIDRGTLGADRADANRPLALRAINSLIKGA